jgi:hypothetical protein
MAELPSRALARHGQAKPLSAKVRNKNRFSRKLPETMNQSFAPPFG